MAGTDFDINLRGNVERQAQADARSIDTLIAALKAEEKALNAANVAAQRAAVGNDPKKYDKAAAVVKETKDKISLLRGEANRIANEKRIEQFYRGSSGAALVSNSIVKKSSIDWKELGSTIGRVAKGGLSVAKTAAVGAAVGIGIAAVAAVALGSKLFSLAKHAITAGLSLADTGRSARLLNEAADIAGGTHKQLGGIIEDVRRRSDVGRERLSEMGRELRILRFDSRQTQLTLGAMAIAESALGRGASAAVQGIAEQSRAMRRFSLGAMDAHREFVSLKKIGLTKADVFAELAKASGQSIGSIQNSVHLGQVSVTRGMAAIDAAMRRKFGGTVNAQANSITSQFRRMREDFEDLFTGADIEPFLASLRSITSVFSQDTASGRAFKTVVTGLLSDIAKTAEILAPDVKAFFLDIAASAAQPGGLAETIRGWISDAKELGGSLKDVAEAIKSIGKVASAVAHPIDTFVEKFKYDGDKGLKYESIVGTDAMSVAEAEKSGMAITAGISRGIERGTPGAVGSITALSQAMQSALRKDNKIQSPSKVYENITSNIPAGVARGVDRGAPQAVEAVVDMSAAMRGGFSPSSPVAVPTGGPVFHIANLSVAVPTGRVVDFVRELRFAAEGGPQ